MLLIEGPEPLPRVSVMPARQLTGLFAWGFPRSFWAPGAPAFTRPDSGRTDMLT